MHGDGDRFQDDVKVVILGRFSDHARASIVVARLREAGISCFVSNQNATTVLPFMADGYILHVSEDDVVRARQIVEQIEEEVQSAGLVDYRDADLDDIAFEKAIFESEQRMQRKEGRWLALILIIIALILIGLRAYSKERDKARPNIGTLIYPSATLMPV